MNHIDSKKQAPLLALQLLRIKGFEILHFFTEIGVANVKQLLSMRVYDYLNLNHIDNNIAEEALLCIYRFFYPERVDLDVMICLREVEQPINLRAWKNKIVCKEITVGDLLAKDFVNEGALSQIFYYISQSFYKSDEYDWHEYRYFDYSDYLRHRKNN